MNFRSLLILLLTLFYFGFGWWYYTCKIKGFCGAVPAPTTVVSQKSPLLFKWNSKTPIVNDQFKTYKTGILQGNKNTNTLEIVGHYFEGENPEVGLQRAKEIQKLFTEGQQIDAKQIRLQSSKVPLRERVKEQAFTSASFKFTEDKATKLNPVSFKSGSINPVYGPGWAKYKNDLLQQKGEDKVLEITGYYYGDEKNSSNYENLGIARANKVKPQFIKEVAKDKIEVKGEKLSGRVTDDGVRIPKIRWLIRNEVIQELDGKALIYFPYDSDQGKLDPRIIDYLNDLAKDLKSTDNRLSIVGHTDNKGAPAYNQKLGMDRANFVKSVLTKKGVLASKVAVSSKGETMPIESNDTEKGRQKNRRTELILNK